MVDSFNHVTSEHVFVFERLLDVVDRGVGHAAVFENVKPLLEGLVSGLEWERVEVEAGSIEPQTSSFRLRLLDQV